MKNFIFIFGGQPDGAPWGSTAPPAYRYSSWNALLSWDSMEQAISIQQNVTFR
jgi:hypothetical protein